MSDLNPRYLAYMHAHGASDPDAMQTLDGFKMVGFIIWIGRQVRAWLAETGRHPVDATKDGGLDAWLAERHRPPRCAICPGALWPEHRAVITRFSWEATQ